jgi:hypothetical protein
MKFNIEYIVSLDCFNYIIKKGLFYFVDFVNDKYNINNKIVFFLFVLIHNTFFIYIINYYILKL